MKILDKVKAAFQTLKKQYRRSNVHSRNLLVLLAVLVLGVVFFLTSYQWMPKTSSGTKLTAIDVETEYEKRKVTIRRWQYSPAEQTMEIELDIENTAFDGLDTYSYAMRTSNGSKITTCPVTIIVEDPTLAIIQVHHVPAQFLEAALYMMITDPEKDHDYLTLYTNNTSVESVDSLPELSKADYMRNRLEREIIATHKEIDANFHEMEEMEDRIDKLYETIAQLESNKKYQTADEIRRTDQSISNHVLTIQDITKKMLEVQEKNNLLNEKIDELTKAKGEIKD